MDTHETREATCEKVQIIATLTAANCESRKEECDERKSMTPYCKSLPVATETGVVICYCLINSVTNHFQR